MFDENRRILRIGGALVVGIPLFIVLAVVFPPVVGADHSYIVLSDSMEPAIESGDVVFVDDVPPERIERGDIITFSTTGAEQPDTTHRVTDVVRQDDGRYFRTKGDANDDADPRLVASHEVQGRVTFGIPYIGHFLLFARTRLGIGLLVMLPAGLLVVSEIWDLGRAYRAETISDQVDEDSTARDTDSSKDG